MLKATHFTVLLGPDGASTISHESDIAPPSRKLPSGFANQLMAWNSF